MNGEESIITVFIIASSPVVRAGLQSVLANNERFIVTGGAAKISDAPFDLQVSQMPDVFLINIERQKELDALIEFLDETEEEMGNSPVSVALLAPDYYNPDWQLQLLQNNVRGILPHDASADEITAALTATANGLIGFLPELLETVLSFSPTPDSPTLMIENNKQNFQDEMIETLTARERQILEMLGEGMSNKSIAYQLNISEHTVKFHVSSVFGKLGVNTRTEAVTQALRRGLILL